MLDLADNTFFDHQFNDKPMIWMFYDKMCYIRNIF